MRAFIDTAMDTARAWIARHEGTRQWLWFIALWLGGLLAVSLVAYPIKGLIRFMSAE